MRFQKIEFQLAWERAAANREAMLDPERGLIYEIMAGINYHTAVTGGVVHRTRDNAEYMTVLFTGEDPAGWEKAGRILEQLLPLQDADPDSPTYGVWPYLWEEPLDRMKNPDWNWACFISRPLLVLLKECPQRLTEDQLTRTRQAVYRACECVLRRNMAVDYTNICLMSAFVLVCGGEVLGEERFVSEGLALLEAQLVFTEKNGGFAEYNSPCYGVIDLEETGRALRYFEGSAVRAAVGLLHRRCWEVFSGHYHAATKQISPPHARGYADLPDNKLASILQLGTGLPLLESEELVMDVFWPFMDVVCPPDLLDGFRPRTEAVEVREQFYRGYNPIPDHQTRILLEKDMPTLTSCAWLHPDYCLGSFDRHDLWNQRKSLMGYFATERGPICFRARCLHDQMDYASAVMVNAQIENAVAGGVSFVTDHGDYHYILTPLQNKTITADCLCMQFGFTGPVETVTVEQEADRLWRFRMPGRDLLLTILTAAFGENDVQFETYAQPDQVGLRVIFARGEHLTIDFGAMDRAWLAYGLEVVPSGEAFGQKLDWVQTEDAICLTLTHRDQTRTAVSPTAIGEYTKLPAGMKKCYRNGGFYYTEV